MHKLIIAVFAALIMTGCGERYRYPCQDPENWEEKLCKKPYCSANGTCPEDLTHYEKGQALSNKPQSAFKGECK